MSEITLEFLSRQLDRVLDRLGAMEDQMTVQTATISRLDATVGGLTTELRALSRRLDRIDVRVRKLEDEEG